MHVRYTIAECAFGKLLVAATAHGICFVGIGNSEAELESALRGKLVPAAGTHQLTLERSNDADLASWSALLARYCNGEKHALDTIPLDIVRGSPFQRQVWEALRAIPYGETRSYKEVAQAIGSPVAVRAVGGACGANPVAIVVPCHRVIRSDGAPGGYGGGVERKRALLALELRNNR